MKIWMLIFLFFFTISLGGMNIPGLEQFWNEDVFLNKLLSSSNLEINGENKEILKVAFSRALVVLRDSLQDENSKDNFSELLAQTWADEFNSLLQEDFHSNNIRPKKSLKKRILVYSLVTLSVLGIAGLIYWFFMKKTNQGVSLEELKSEQAKFFEILDQKEDGFRKKRLEYELEVRALKLSCLHQEEMRPLLMRRVGALEEAFLTVPGTIADYKTGVDEMIVAFKTNMAAVENLRKNVYEFAMNQSACFNVMREQNGRGFGEAIDQYASVASRRMTQLEGEYDKILDLDRRIKGLEAIDSESLAKKYAGVNDRDAALRSLELTQKLRQQQELFLGIAQETARNVELMRKEQVPSQSKSGVSTIIPKFDFNEVVDFVSKTSRVTRDVRRLIKEVRGIAGNSDQFGDLDDRLNSLLSDLPNVPRNSPGY